MKHPSVSEDLDWDDVTVPSCDHQVRAWLELFQARHKAVLPLLDSDESGLIRALKGYDWSISLRDEWLGKGFVQTLVDELAVSELLWSLARLPLLAMEADLQDLIDRSSALAHLLGGIWELRFRVQDEQAQKGFDLNLPEQAHQALLGWMRGADLTDADRAWLGRAQIEDELAPSERLDVALCLVTIAHFNGVMDPTIVAFDDVDVITGRSPVERRRLVGELEMLIDTATRWVKYGSGLGVLLLLQGGASRFRALKSSSKRLLQSLNSLSSS